MSIAISGSTITFSDLTTQSTASVPGVSFKNRIINGDMRIDQRNAGASLTPTSNGQYTVDRWLANLTVSSKFSVQTQTSVIPSGFSNALKITSLSAYSVGASDYFAMTQPIEGFNTADLAWGTASAATVTLSFRVYSSLTGTFGGSVANGAGNRCYPFTYTVSSANTWTNISVTIAGDTSGTWASNNTVGIYVIFGLGVGATNSGTAGAWAGAFYYSATGATSVVGTNAATFYVTGVQFEVGSTANDFERRPIGTELALCQRYYQKSYGQSVAPGTSVISTYNGIVFSNGVSDSATSQIIPFSVPLCPSMRSTPSLAYWDVNGNVSKFSTFTAGGFARTDNQGGFGATFLTSNALIAGYGVPAVGSCFGFAFAASSEL